MHKGYKVLFDMQKLIQTTSDSSVYLDRNGVYISFDNLKMQVWENEKRIAPFEFLNFGGYEPTYSKTMFQLLEGCSCVFDIGANIGWFSIHFAKILGPQAAIYAFEPIPSTFEKLATNIKLNAISSIHPINIGFSDHKKRAVFFVDPEESTSASERVTTETEKIEISCDLEKLDDFVSYKNLCVDFIKCDVEGGELFVFLGAQRTLASQRPIICTEMLRKWSRAFNYHPNQIIQLLSSKGYECFTPETNGLKRVLEVTNETDTTNFIFLHKEKHAKFLSNLVIPS